MLNPFLFGSKSLGIILLSVAALSALFLCIGSFCMLFKAIKKKQLVLKLNVNTENKNNLNVTKRLPRLQAGCKSFVGTRASQQDRVAAGSTALWMYGIVCDGMGGMNSGELASEYCIKKLVEELSIAEKPNNIAEHFKCLAQACDSSVSALTDSKNNKIMCGTTLSAAVVLLNKLYWVSVGDSRIYLISNHKAHMLTRDQNFQMELAQMVKNGTISSEEAQCHPDKNALVSYIGMQGLAYIDTGEDIPLAAGDKIIVCSDGLFKLLSDKEIADVCEACFDSADAIATALVNSAQSKPAASYDNISVAVILA